jgi:hypothetical protein
MVCRLKIFSRRTQGPKYLYVFDRAVLIDTVQIIGNGQYRNCKVRKRIVYFSMVVEDNFAINIL